jgi:hypothetical protein
MRIIIAVVLLVSAVGITATAPVAATARAAPGLIAPMQAQSQRHARGGQSRRRPAAACTPGPYGFVGGGIGNVAGYGAGVLSGASNSACEDYSGIGVGETNVTLAAVGASDPRFSFIAGGEGNVINTGFSFIGAGAQNSTPLYGGYAGIVSGLDNTVAGDDSFVGAGITNSITGSSSGSPSYIYGGENSAIVGGSGNLVKGTTLSAANQAFIGAGTSNTVGASAANAGVNGFIGAGSSNTVTKTNAAVVAGESNTASGVDAFVPGGNGNTASGTDTFAGGTSSVAGNKGAFVWSDDASSATQLSSSAMNQFLVRASGGTTFYSNATLTTGVTLAAGGGSWASVSDRNVKTNIQPIDAEAILQRVVRLPVTEWSYISEGEVRHLGPMAQDFYASFAIGEDNRHITTIDEDGVSLAAVKGLYAEVQRRNAALTEKLLSEQRQVASDSRRRDARIDSLEREVAELSAEVAKGTAR